MITISPSVHYFTVPVTSDMMVAWIHLDPEYLRNCIDEVKKLGDSQDRQTNLKGFMTSYHVYKETDILNPLLDAILEACNMYATDRKALAEAWVGIYKKGDYAVEHSHLGTSLSFCYYMQAQKEDAAIEFTDANKKFYPTTGMLLVFPSPFKHKVHEQKTDNERVILAGNILFTDQTVNMR